MKMTMTDGTVFEGSMAEYAELIALAKAQDAKVEADVATIKGEQALESKRPTVGDYVRVKKSVLGVNYDASVGEAVKIIEDDRSHLPYYCEQSNGSREWYFAEDVELVAEQTPPVIPQVADVVTFEGFDGEYRKVERKAQAGDVVILRASKRDWFKNGVPRLVTDAVKIRDDDGDYFEVYSAERGRTPETVDVFEKVEAKYVPQEGDIVVVTAKAPPMHGFDIGDIVKITTTDSGGNCDIGITKMGEKTMKTGYTDVDKIRKATPAEVEAYEKAVHKASFSVGDYVKLVNSKRENNGAICVISDIDGLSLPVKLRHISGKFPETTSYATYDQIVKATEQEVADASKPKLKAGDFVKFTKEGDYCEDDITIGKAYEIVDVSELGFYDDDEDFRTAPLEYTECYEILSADEAKWAQIGRKVGELKKGDIVRIIDACGAELDDGVLIEVISDSRESSAHVKGDWAVYSELIAPVESTLK